MLNIPPLWNTWVLRGRSHAEYTASLKHVGFERQKTRWIYRLFETRGFWEAAVTLNIPPLWNTWVLRGRSHAEYTASLKHVGFQRQQSRWIYRLFETRGFWETEVTLNIPPLWNTWVLRGRSHAEYTASLKRVGFERQKSRWIYRLFETRGFWEAEVTLNKSPLWNTWVLRGRSHAEYTASLKRDEVKKTVRYYCVTLLRAVKCESEPPRFHTENSAPAGPLVSVKCAVLVCVILGAVNRLIKFY